MCPDGSAPATMPKAPEAATAPLPAPLPTIGVPAAPLIRGLDDEVVAGVEMDAIAAVMPTDPLDS